MTNQKELEGVIYDMLKENTGIAMCDSGGNNGRSWQRNADKTLEDFEKAESVEVEQPYNSYTLTENGEFVRRANNEQDLLDIIAQRGNADKVAYKIERDKVTTEDCYITVDTFHYLTSGVIELDAFCREFNAMGVDDWDGSETIDAYGVSKDGAKWLEDNGLKVTDSWNTYNGEDNLSQTLQGANVVRTGNESNFEFPDYVLLQIHGGADVRGGYTDAKLFKISDNTEGYINPCPPVYAKLTKKNGDTIELETFYNGVSLTTENGDTPEVEQGDTITGYICD